MLQSRQKPEAGTGPEKPSSLHSALSIRKIERRRTASEASRDGPAALPFWLPTTGILSSQAHHPIGLFRVFAPGRL